jgi:hypothetical protein
MVEEEAPPADKADDNDKGEEKGEEEKKDDEEANPENTGAKASMDNFLGGKKPNGKSRKCTDCLCLILLVSEKLTVP